MPAPIRSCLVASLILLGIEPVFAQDCKPAHAVKTIEPGYITAATTTFAPFSLVAQNGEIGGVDGDVVKAVAARECLKVKPVAVDPAAAIQYVLSGRADLATGDWYRTAERAKVLGLSAPLYTDQMGVFSKDGLTKVADLVGKKVGTVQGYLWVEDLKKLLGADLKLYPNAVNLAQDLAAGRLDIGVDSYAVGVVAQSQGGYKGLKIKVADRDDRVRATKEAAQAGFPYTLGNAGLGTALDEDIRALHADGTMAKILIANGLEASAGEVGAPRLVQ